MEALKVTQKLRVKSHPIIDRSINIPMGKQLFKDNIKDTTASSIDVVLVSWLLFEQVMVYCEGIRKK